MISFLFVILGCWSTEDPELTSYRKALAEYEQGVEHLSEQRWGEALASFEKAQAIRPEDVLLSAWRAKVLAESGELEQAVEQLNLVIKQRPNFAEARYNRSAYAARLERFEESAADLKVLIASERYRPEDVYADPDFAEVVEKAPFNFLPKAVMKAMLSLPEHRVVAGTEVPVRIDVESRLELGSLSVEGEMVGPIRLVKVVENVDDQATQIVWTARVEGEGRIGVGPVSLGSTTLEDTTLGRREFESWLPEGRKGGPIRNYSLKMPSSLASERTAPDTWREGESLFVLIEKGQVVKIAALDSVEPIRYERRRNGVSDWVLLEYPSDTSVDVHIIHRGKTVLKASR